MTFRTNANGLSGKTKGQKRRILILEDDVGLQTVLERIIQSSSPGAEIHWATSAEQALTQFRRSPFDFLSDCDLIIADIFLEGSITGLDFWNLCQSACPDTPILITSSMPLDGFLKCVGPDSITPPFLPKPFSVAQCQQMIEGLLDYRDRSVA